MKNEVRGLRVIGPQAVLSCAFVLAALAVLPGCSKQATSETQVAARVNDEEVSIHQVQQALQQQPRLVSEQGEAAPRMALDSLIEQELAAQAARQAGLDRDPAVIQALEAAKRETLARAFQDRLAAEATQPDSDTLDRYYDAHPDRFAKRRLYSLQEFSIEANPKQRESVRSLLQSANTPAELQQGLQALKLRYSTRPMLAATEAVPTVLRDALRSLPPGNGISFDRPRGVQVFYLASVQELPLDRQAAHPIIEAELLATARREHVERGMKPLRDAARIDRLGKFAQAGAPAPAASPP